MCHENKERMRDYLLTYFKKFVHFEVSSSGTELQKDQRVLSRRSKILRETKSNHANLEPPLSAVT